MAQKEISVPDTAQTADDYLAETTDLLGDKLQINMGPSHPATHGVLRLKLELDGEIILSADPVIGYLHRGDEKIAENMHYNQFVPYTDRLDYLAPLACNIAYACAVEKLLGWELPPRGQALRVLASEFSRISSHMLGVGVFGMDVGAMTVFLYSYVEREKTHNFMESLTGARFTTSWTRIGGQTRDASPELLADIKKALPEFHKALDEIDALLKTNKMFRDRVDGIGVISREDAISYALTGPNLRASGVERDLRKNAPYLGYEQYDFDVPVGETGDCYDRYTVRMEEMRQSIRIIEQVIDNMPDGPINVMDAKGRLPNKEEVLMDMEQLIHQFIIATQGVNAPAGEVYFAAENPKGEQGFHIVSKGGGVPHRLRIRSSCMPALSLIPKLFPGHMISDIPAILGSFDFVMGECDR